VKEDTARDRKSKRAGLCTSAEHRTT